ncbi:protein of unknown function [Magnetospirillum sp. XM-1]|nr:protein of unknown function [Magnetospirillum sp. XM-1]
MVLRQVVGPLPRLAVLSQGVRPALARLGDQPGDSPLRQGHRAFQHGGQHRLRGGVHPGSLVGYGDHGGHLHGGRGVHPFQTKPQAPLRSKAAIAVLLFFCDDPPPAGLHGSDVRGVLWHG